jgi:hypothetical protein
MKKTTEEIAVILVDWCRNRLEYKGLNSADYKALQEEWFDWLEPQGPDIEIWSLDMEKIALE